MRVQPYVIVLSEAQSKRLQEWCTAHHWSAYSVPYAVYAYRSEECNFVLYCNRKLVVQGRKASDFITGVLEPEITQKALYGYDQVHHPEWFEAHAGLDESGKGDLFGPLVAACVIADKKMVEFWMAQGLRESKAVEDQKRLFKLEELIRGTKGVVVETAYAHMERYNQLYQKFGNLNLLLAWFHARALEAALKRRKVEKGLLDQFAKTPSLMDRYFKQKDFTLAQRTHAEEDPVVAAASIIARAAYIKHLQALSKEVGWELPKGCGDGVKKALKTLVTQVGPQQLNRYAKMHFKTVREAVQ